MWHTTKKKLGKKNQFIKESEKDGSTKNFSFVVCVLPSFQSDFLEDTDSFVENNTMPQLLESRYI